MYKRELVRVRKRKRERESEREKVFACMRVRENMAHIAVVHNNNNSNKKSSVD